MIVAKYSGALKSLVAASAMSLLCAMPAQAQEKLFDGFFSSKVSGNGIGLALCKNIIGRHRGDIWAQNLEPCGAVFSFSLPLIPPAI